MISADVKAKNTTRNETFGGCTLQIFLRSTFKI